MQHWGGGELWEKASLLPPPNTLDKTLFGVLCEAAVGAMIAKRKTLGSQKSLHEAHYVG